MISTDCRKCVKSDFCYVDDVKPCIGYEPKKLTNADRIRSMTDEELAEWLKQVASSDWKYSSQGVMDKHELCGGTITAWLEWLKQEAKT